MVVMYLLRADTSPRWKIRCIQHVATRQSMQEGVLPNASAQVSPRPGRPAASVRDTPGVCTAPWSPPAPQPPSPRGRRASGPWAHIDAGSGSLPASARNAPSGKSPCGTYAPHAIGRGSGGYQTASTIPAVCQHSDTLIVKRLDFHPPMA